MALKFLSILFSLGILVSCGKDSSTNTSGSSAQPYSTPVQQLSNNISSNNGQTAYNNLLAWYNSTAENTTPQRSVLEQRLIQTFSKPNCETNTYLGFINLQTCFGTTSGSSRYEYRTITPTSTTNKSLNSKLSVVFQPTTVMNLVGVSQTNGIFGKPLYQVDYVKYNGHVLRYKIDTGLNSAFNPVEIYNSEIGTKESLTSPNLLR